MRFPKTTEYGQTTIEFALILPLVVAFGLLFLQLGLIVKAQITLAHSVREGARAFAIYYDDYFYEISSISADAAPITRNFSQKEAEGIATQAIINASNLDSAKTQINISYISENLVEIKVIYRAETNVPLIGDWISDINLSSSLKVSVFEPNSDFQKN